MAYTGEELRSGVVTFLQAGIAAALDTVEAGYAASDPVTLDDIVTWHEGHNPEVLELESTAFPFMAVMVGNRIPDQSKQGRAQWKFQEFDVLVYVDCFVVADDIATVNKRVHRYAKAIVAVLQTQRYIEGHKQNNYEPEVKISEATRHPKTANSDLFNSDDVDYIQVGRVIVSFEGSS